MAAPMGSFAHLAQQMRNFNTPQKRNVSSQSKLIEQYDEDFEACDLLVKSTVSATLSSRMSLRSESVIEDEEAWQVLIAPNDQPSTAKAVRTAAKDAGIPIPENINSAALLGGSIKRLGQKKSTKKFEKYDDFDLEFPQSTLTGLKLKAPQTPTEDTDDLDWGDGSLGSLGIRFAGTRNARGARSSSVSAISPSMGSCITAESEEDNFNGLVLPSEPLNFTLRLEKLKNPPQLQTLDFSPSPTQQLRNSPFANTKATMSTPNLPSPPVAFTPPSPFQSPALDKRISPLTTPKTTDDDDDFFADLDFGGGIEIFDEEKVKVNRNVVVKKSASKLATTPQARPSSTITFTDRPAASRIPRPLPVSRTRLTPLYETNASAHNHSRPAPTTTSAQLLKSKRSAPALRTNIIQSSRTPFVPTGTSALQSHHIQTRSSQPHLRLDSDPRRPISPVMRSFSRQSAHGETPSRAGIRRDLAPSALGRHPPPKKLTQPQRRRNFGDGHELDLFDDLPTSATKEKQYEKVPRNVSSNKSLRTQPSNSRLPMPDRMNTPMPQTPRSPPKMDFTPRFARDTAASRNAREQRLAGTRSRADGLNASRPMSWAAQVAARSPHNSPTAHRKKNIGQKPQLIRQMTQPFSHNEKGMIYNPTMQRWEGNEEALVSFTHPNTSTTSLVLTTANTPTIAQTQPHRHHDRSYSIPQTSLSPVQAAQKTFSARAAKLVAPSQAIPIPVPSPPRPALISQISVPRGVQYEGRMVFDPVKMTWLKAPRRSTDPVSPSELEDEEDPFAGLDDLKDDSSLARSNGGFMGSVNAEEQSFVGEEFDVGPSFIRRQKDEEAIWRKKVEGWVGGLRDAGERRGGWRWAIRDFAASASAGGLGN